jgi:basic amino acid/polyamine antiporter, APA family
MTASPARAAGDVSDPAPSRLARRLGVGDAVVIGLGSMIGAGVFAAVGPAARAAGAGLLIGLVIAAVVAFCNATSSTALAVVYPASGGAYVYGRQRLGPFWGYLAGWGFVVGKIASCAAMALTVGAYAAPSLQRPVAITAIFGLAAVNYRGIHKTAALTRLIVAVVLAALTVVVIGALFGGQASGTHFNGDLITGGWRGVLESAGLLFFAFAGYARIATLGEEVDDPARTIPKAIPRALGITLLVYLVVAVSALAAAGPTALARSSAPLATVVRAGDLDALTPAVRIGGTIAALGVLLSLIAGVGRTVFAMAADREMPGWLDAVHSTHKVPHRAELTVAAIVAAVVVVADVREAIGFSSVCVLTYYAIANAAAWTLPREHLRWRRALAGLGLVGCVALAITLSTASVLTGAGVLCAGTLIWLSRHRLGRRVRTTPSR